MSLFRLPKTILTILIAGPRELNVTFSLFFHQEWGGFSTGGGVVVGRGVGFGVVVVVGQYLSTGVSGMVFLYQSGVVVFLFSMSVSFCFISLVISAWVWTYVIRVAIVMIMDMAVQMM